MKTITVHLGDRSYPVHIAPGSLKSTGRIVRKLALGDHALIITNRTLARRFAKPLRQSLTTSGLQAKCFTVIDSERAKSASVCMRLAEQIAQYDTKKRIFLIALGGGVVGDLTGFVAAIYKRGIPYIQIPTSLLAQIDSAIGGKAAIDLPIAKNLIGAFYQPRAVIVDPQLLRTLPKRQRTAGLAEIIKYAVIKDPQLFRFLEAKYAAIARLDQRALSHIESRCIAIKAHVVEHDEYDKKGIRAILNFGHTIGHALESALGYQKLNHGEAVTIGMICAAELAVQLKLFTQRDYARLCALIKRYGLPTRIPRVNTKRVLASLQKDKKFVCAKNRFVLPVKIGKVILREEIPERLIAEVIEDRTD